MGSNLVIAAIPDENDRVWKVSSEKIPHLTILHLGDSKNVANLEQIMLFVEHAATTSLKCFYLPVDRRGELGVDNADVLFFKKNRYDFKAVHDFRSLLLQDQNIKTAYDASTQFETPETVGTPGHPWIPHLTLGYPETPAKPEPDDYSNFYSVEFNKIAVWVGDFEGPDWRLKDLWDDEWDFPMDAPLSVAMSGVKGMRWGQRKSDARISISPKTGMALPTKLSLAAVVVPGAVILPLGGLAFLSPRVREEFKQSRAINGPIQADKQWHKQVSSSKKAVEVHNASADEVNKKIPSFNADKRWKNADGSKIDLNKNPAKLAEYNRAAEHEILNPAYANAAIKIHGAKSPGGRYKFEIKDSSTGLLSVTDSTPELKHADDNKLSVTFEISRDENGHIVGMKEKDDSMAQTVELGEEFIEHYGAKGMKWGVRKAETRKGQFDPEGHALSTDVTKSLLYPIIPVIGSIAAIPANVRLIRGGARGANAKLIDHEEKKFAKKAHSEKNFVEIHNRSGEKFNREIGAINAKHSGDLTKDPKKQKAYDADVQKLMNTSYSEAAKSIGNKNRTMHLDVEFGKNGQDFNVHAKEGKPTPLPRQVVHAVGDDEETFTYSGKVKRDVTGHIVGFEFDDFKEESMSQTLDLGMAFLEHHGVKGMRWGVSKENVGNAARSAGGALGKATIAVGKFAGDVGFESKTNPQVHTDGSIGNSQAYHIVAGAAEHDFRHKDLKTINAKPEHVKASKLRNRLLHPFDKGTRAYRNEVKTAYIKRLETTANSMKNASGSREYTIRERGGDLPTHKYIWEVSSREARHAAGDDFVLVDVLTDVDGFITGTKIVEDTLAQTADIGAEFLAHHGVKGMKWGVRRERGTAGFLETRKAVAEAKTRVKRTPIESRVQDSIGKSGKKKTTIASKGGEDHPATPDAIRVAASTQKLKKSGVHALSNKELQDVATRLNLETQVSVLMGKNLKKGVGAKFVEKQLKDAQNNPMQAFNKGKKLAKVAGPVIKTGKTLIKMRKLAGVP